MRWTALVLLLSAAGCGGKEWECSSRRCSNAEPTSHRLCDDTVGSIEEYEADWVRRCRRAIADGDVAFLCPGGTEGCSVECRQTEQTCRSPLLPTMREQDVAR